MDFFAESALLQGNCIMNLSLIYTQLLTIVPLLLVTLCAFMQQVDTQS